MFIFTSMRFKIFTAFLLGILLVPVLINAQSTVITGQISDVKTLEALVGVNVVIKGTFVGTSSNSDGSFQLETNLLPPFNVRISIVGYQRQEIEVTSATQNLKIVMAEQVLVGQEVVISASRIEETLLTSPVSIEKIDMIKLQQTTAANFYDGLYNLKGVDMNVQSLTFRVPNTRGFNGNTNYRLNQLVDGMENIPPGLSFAAGNILGLSQVDVETWPVFLGVFTHCGVVAW